jgi:hypothetical protein
VARGAQVGEVDNSGANTGGNGNFSAHLHFVYYNPSARARQQGLVVATADRPVEGAGPLTGNNGDCPITNFSDGNFYEFRTCDQGTGGNGGGNGGGGGGGTTTPKLTPPSGPPTPTPGEAGDPTKPAKSTFTIGNSGNAELIINSSVFTVTSGADIASVNPTLSSLKIAPGGTATVNVTATCAKAGTLTGNLFITSNGGTITVPITITCIGVARLAGPTPGEITLTGNVGELTNLETFTISNVGTADLTYTPTINYSSSKAPLTAKVGTGVLVSSDASAAEKVNNPTVQPLTAQVNCLEAAEGTGTITFRVTSSGPTNGQTGTLKINVLCIGKPVPSAGSISSSLTLVTQPVSETLPVTLKNTGTAPYEYSPAFTLSGNLNSSAVSVAVNKVGTGVVPRQTLDASGNPVPGTQALEFAITCNEVTNGPVTGTITITGINKSAGINVTIPVSVTCDGKAAPSYNPSAMSLEAKVGDTIDDARTEFTVTNSGYARFDYVVEIDPGLSGGIASVSAGRLPFGNGALSGLPAAITQRQRTSSLSVTCLKAGTVSGSVTIRGVSTSASFIPHVITVNVTCKGTPSPVADKTSLTLEGKGGSSTNADSVNVTNLAPAATGQYDYTVTFTSSNPSIATLEKTTVGNGVILVNGSQAIGAQANCVKAGTTSGTMLITGLPNTLSSGKSISVNAHIKCTGPSLYADRDLDFGDVFWGSSTTAGMYLQNFDAVQGINDPATLEYEIVNLPTWLTVVNGTQQGSVLAGRQIEVRFNAACPNLGRFEADVLFRATNVPWLEQTRHFSVNCVSRVDVVARFVGADYYGTYAADSGSKNEVIATVSNDPSNAGVTWTASFGTLSYEGDKVFWTAPIQNPDSGEGFRQVKLTATSRADQTRSGIALGTVRGISVNGGQAAGYGLLRDFVSVTLTTGQKSEGCVTHAKT